MPYTDCTVVVADIFYNGEKGNKESDEYIEILIDDVVAIQLKGWPEYIDVND